LLTRKQKKGHSTDIAVTITEVYQNAARKSDELYCPSSLTGGFMNSSYSNSKHVELAKKIVCQHQWKQKTLPYSSNFKNSASIKIFIFCSSTKTYNNKLIVSELWRKVLSL
jgi:hypothetical protein